MTGRTELVERLGEQVVALDRADPGDGLDDLRPIADRLRGKRVVGLGEATHGTREFFRLKHRLVRLLVTELDCRLVGLEANFAEVRALDDYVTGKSDREAALDVLSYWTWRTEAVREMVEWMRRYNAGRPASEQVRFYGYDVRSTRGPARALRAFLDRVDPDYLPEVEDDLRALESGWMEDGHEVEKEHVLAAEAVASVLSERFEERADAYRSAVGDREWRLARRRRRLVEQAYEFVAAGLFDDDTTPNGVRDAAMAENVSWMLDHEDADRIALWAHNGHVRTGGPASREWESMGRHLRREHGEEYYALGFEFGRGTFRAYPDPETADEFAVGTRSLATMPDGSVPATLDAVGEPICYLDVESASEDPAVRTWLEGERPMHSIGAVHHDDPDESYAPVVLSDSFDGLLYVAETEAAVPVGDG